MVNVCIAGVTGWTAAALVPAVAAADDLDLTSGVSRSASGRVVADVVDGGPSAPVFGSVADALAGASVDVLVDYTSAAAVRENVWTAVEAGVDVVVGSSGLTSADYEELDRLARDRGVGVVAAGNFSVAAAILRRAASLAAARMPHWEVVDYADASKPDVPSGTARELAETLAAVRAPEGAVPIGDLRGPVEARGADVAGGRVHSVRLPGFVVTTEVVFGGDGERLIMRHDPGESATPYVEGTLTAIRRVADGPGLRRGLDTLLFD